MDGAPAGEDADGSEQAGQDDEPERKAVDAEVVADGGNAGCGGEDRDVLDELEASLAVGEVRGQVERHQEGDDGGDEGDGLRELAALGQQGDEKRADKRCGENEAENDCVHDYCPIQLK